MRKAGSGKGGKKGGWGRRIGLGIVFTLLAGLILGLGAFLYLYVTLAVPEADDLALAETTTVHYADGQTELGTLGEFDREIIDTTQLPDYVAKAVVASEDRTFYTNSGIDFKGIFRAVVNNVTQGTRQGGSTLTQQYVERYYMGETTSYTGKIKEAVLAVKINREQSKEQVIGNYLNTIYFGRGAYGIESASQAYFGHPATEMTLSEAAMIAGIIPAPSAWDPAVDEAQAQQRWERVLGLMVEDGWISQADADGAQFPETVDPTSRNQESLAGPNGYLIAQIKAELIDSGAFTEDEINMGGLDIISTIDKAKQDAAIAAAESMKEVEGWDSEHMHVALTSIDPATGEILAEYGGSDYLTRQQNGATQDVAMAGSSFKTFSLLANARAGGSVYDTFNGNSPQTFPGMTTEVQNDSNYSWGNVSLVRATQYSVNTAFVALNEKIGAEATMRAAIDAGIPEDTLGLEATLLNTLGFAAPHNIDLATAYATIASGGNRTDAHIVRSVSDSAGNKVYESVVTTERMFEAEEVSSILPALEAVTAYGGTAEAVAQALPSFTIAGKTGTSEEQRSAQFVGFVPGMSTAVSMYQSDDEGNAVPLTNIGGLDQFHGGDWPVDVWTQYMVGAVSDANAGDFDWRVTSNRTAAPQRVQPTQPVEEEKTEDTESPATQPTQPARPTPGQNQNSGENESEETSVNQNEDASDTGIGNTNNGNGNAGSDAGGTGNGAGTGN